MEIDKLGNELVNCNLHCPGITREPERGIIPRTLIHEKRNGNNKIIVVGLNPGKAFKGEPEYYLSCGCSYQSLKDYFEKVLKSKDYFKKTKELISCLGYDGDIFWTNLVKCECSGKNGNLYPQTKRVCIKKYLRKEIPKFPLN